LPVQRQVVVDRFHDQVANMILTTDSYLRLPISGYVSRSFSLYIDPLVAPSEVNARNYGANYMMLMAPDHGGLKIEPVRHTYLHYILDPLTLKRFNRMIPLKPLLQTVANAPLDDKFKTDIALLVTESLIHAVEIRTTPVPGVAAEDRKERDKRIEGVRSHEVDDAMQQGFVLTHYFYDQFANFEKGEVGFQDAFGPYRRYNNANADLYQVYNNLAPLQVTVLNTPREVQENLAANVGAYPDTHRASRARRGRTINNHTAPSA
jgi:hypothetical protein